MRFALILLGYMALQAFAATGNLINTCAPAGSNSNTDYFPDKVSTIFPETSLSVQYSGANYKVIDSNRTDETYVLYQCGTTAPTINDASNTYVKTFPVAGRTIRVGTTIYVGFLEMLGLRQNITQIGDAFTAGYIVSPCIQKMYEQGLITVQSNNGSDVNDLPDVDVVFSGLQYPAPDYTPKPYPNPKYVSFDPSGDGTNLQRANSIKVLATFFNLEKKANAIYSQLVQNWNCLLNQTNAHASSVKPVVAWVSAYAGFPTLYASIYRNDFVTSAGGTLLSSSATLSSLEDLKAVIMNADILFDESYFDASVNPSPNFTDILTNLGINSTEAEQFKFVQKDQVYRVDKQRSAGGGFGWFEGLLARPDWALMDVMSIITPSSVNGHTRTFFRQIRRNTTSEGIVTVNSTDCPDIYQPVDFGSNVTQLCSCLSGGGSIQVKSLKISSCIPPKTTAPTPTPAPTKENAALSYVVFNASILLALLASMIAVFVI